MACTTVTASPSNSSASQDAFAPTRVHMHRVRSTLMTSLTKSHIPRALGTRARVARVVAAVALAGAFTAACDVHGVSEPGTLSTLTISPDPQSMAISGTQQFTAVARDFSGAIVTSEPVWSIVAGGGTISGAGLFTAGTAPQTYTNTVQATSGGL